MKNSLGVHPCVLSERADIWIFENAVQYSNVGALELSTPKLARMLQTSNILHYDGRIFPYVHMQWVSIKLQVVVLIT